MLYKLKFLSIDNITQVHCHVHLYVMPSNSCYSNTTPMHKILICYYGVPFVSKLDEIEVFINVRGYLQMSVDIYKCPWIFTNVSRYLQISMGIYKCQWIFANVSRYFQMLLEIYECHSMIEINKLGIYK